MAVPRRCLILYVPDVFVIFPSWTSDYWREMIGFRYELADVLSIIDDNFLINFLRVREIYIFIESRSIGEGRLFVVKIRILDRVILFYFGITVYCEKFV